MTGGNGPAMGIDDRGSSPSSRVSSSGTPRGTRWPRRRRIRRRQPAALQRYLRRGYRRGQARRADSRLGNRGEEAAQAGPGTPPLRRIPGRSPTHRQPAGEPSPWSAGRPPDGPRQTTFRARPATTGRRRRVRAARRTPRRSHRSAHPHRATGGSRPHRYRITDDDGEAAHARR